MKRVAILLSGGGSNMVALADSMTGDHPARPALVLSNRADAGGLQKAAARGIATEVVDHRPHGEDRAAFEEALHAAIMAHEPDIICLAGFMRVLTEGFVSRWQGRMINIHPSLLPKYRGLHTHQRALDAGEAEAGCTVHEVTAALDDGPILGQARVAVLPGDSAETLAARVLEAEHRLYPAVLRRFAAGDRSPLYLP
ncbi:phosphoribosylglycinamide formyltransferase-1 [Roseovarius nanhaiticus]|uniref:Phosphoribosylglycinamide formyltransferase n=1 Tax=Roseovarius nanhaiticus TaxID=573024 RepID=A0A1N7G7U6_9RHOB|nr:phosphoribosylglycinamide formyltransferase [Roseovarius nanhaiticus]SEK35198.1 phosphoribosylglycinamide formyltransferase-1 [Roseovarius nanhaiticus]SIS08486.1 phosphoribosylglycinamide formyltransferase-1 [Roseovarius nanhaiticus]